MLVAQDGQVLYKKGFGYADVAKKLPVTTATKFRIGSITKQFTAASILRLQEQGRINVTDKLSKFFPDFPRADEVTIHHLLTHTSGIHSYTGKPDFVARVVKPITNDALVAYFKNDPYDFNPGDDYRYNNSAYLLLGIIVEKVSGKSYAAFLQETFFDPLGMKNTGVHTSSAKLTNEARGYTTGNKGFEPALNWDMSWAGGAGALYSTVEDLYLWNEAVFQGKVLSPESMKAAFTPVTLNNGQVPQGGRYGYGWVLQPYRGVEEIQHGGGLHGFVSALARYPQQNLSVVLLTNVTPSQVNVDPNRVAEYFLWDKLEKQPSFSTKDATTKDASQYVGRYDFGNGAVMTFTAEGTDLYAQLTGQPRFPVFPSGPDEFIWKVVDARIKFVRNAAGEITHGHFKQGGYELDTKRLKDDTIVSLDPAVYNNYTGIYDYGENILVTVTAESGKLFVQPTNQPKLEIFPVSENEFVLREMNARITFIKQGDKVAKAVLDMGGKKRDMPRLD